MAYGLTFPFRLATASNGYFEVTQTIMGAVVENVKSLILTNWGERPMNYYFGCNLREFLFEQQTDSTKRRIAGRIGEQFSLHFPFLEIESLEVFFSTDDPTVEENTMNVRLTFFFSDDPQKAATIITVIR
jgi:phage baseplate assembly protein W